MYCVSVYDLSPLSTLTGLQELDLHTLQEANGLHADSLSPLSALSKLRALGLQGSDAGIVDSCPWHSLTRLTRVDLHGSCVSDLSPLTCLAGLQALDLTGATAWLLLAATAKPRTGVVTYVMFRVVGSVIGLCMWGLD